MKVLNMRLCLVDDAAAEIADTLAKLGLPKRDTGAAAGEGTGFAGAIFAAQDGGWAEFWPPSADMPPGMMLQIVVDDADAWADRARESGLDPLGPHDAHGERIYFLPTTGGLALTFQSRL